MILTWLLFFAVLTLFGSSLILLRNRVDLTRLPSGGRLSGNRDADPAKSPSQEQPLVNILIPARNEETTIEACVERACNQEYEPLKVFVYDDESQDQTGAILTRLAGIYPDRLKIVAGQEKPEEWLGKPWACSRLAESADGEYLFFLDADVLIEPDTVQRSLYAFHQYRLDMLTVWPRQILGSFWEKTLIPLVYYVLLTLLPAVYVYRPPRWLPSFLRQPTRTWFAAACGQFMAFTREAYRLAGGHHNVKNHPVDDVALARLVKKKGLRLRMFEGTDTMRCRMYRSEREIRNGFKKNFFAGFGNSSPPFLLAGILHFVVYVLPFVMLPLALIRTHPGWLFLSAIAVTLIFIHWLILSRWFGWNPLYAFMHPVAVLWFHRLALLIFYDRVTGRKTLWKDRPV